MSPQLLSPRPGLAERVEGVIRSRTRHQVRQLQVEVFDDCIVVDGIASSFYAKQLATNAAQSFGIPLQNRIRVG